MVVPATDELCYESAGYSLHAATRIEAEARDRLERLVRYVARPPLAQGRLEVRGDGKVKWSLRRPWRAGTRAFVFDPLTFLERLVAMVLHPREHQLTYFGVLAPASPLHDAAVPRPVRVKRHPEAGEPDSCAQSSRRTWAELLERTFGVDVLRCPRCDGRRHRIATITDPIVIRKVLSHLGLRAEPPELAPARPEPQMRFARRRAPVLIARAEPTSETGRRLVVVVRHSHAGRVSSICAESWAALRSREHLRPRSAPPSAVLSLVPCTAAHPTRSLDLLSAAERGADDRLCLQATHPTPQAQPGAQARSASASALLRLVNVVREADVELHFGHPSHVRVSV